MKKIKVKTGSKNYDVVIGKNVFSDAIRELKKNDCKFLLICDSNVYKYHKPKIDHLLKFNRNTILYLFNSSERNKSLKSTEAIYNSLLEKKFSRKDGVIVIGGGIPGDVAGFVAATYMRGIKLFQIPTTLLSIVDSSVGGKTGINFRDVKNLIGAFKQPEKVYADLSFLSTLPFEEVISGAGEIFKYAFLLDDENYLMIKEKLFEILLNKSFDENLIARCIKIKSVVVEQDEYETSGLRKILNLGHTFAHAFESALKFKVKHGEAVIAGVFASLIISQKIGLISKSTLEQYLSDFDFIPINKKIIKVYIPHIIHFMKSDKKTSEGKIKLVLVSKPGNILIDVNVSEKIVNNAMRDFFNTFKKV